MLTKAEMAKLTDEQQELVARLELSKLRQRQQLIEVIRDRNWYTRSVPIVLLSAPWLVLMVMAFFKVLDSNQMTYVIYASVAWSFCGCIILEFHARINQRLDAMLELLDLDRKDQADSQKSKDKKTTDLAL